MSFSALQAHEKKAKEHIMASESSLEVNVFKMKFKADFFQAASHMQEAAQCYGSARMDSDMKLAYIKAAELWLKTHDHASAARCYELASSFDKAVECYFLCGTLDQAVRSIMKKANSSSDPALQMECYEKAIEIYSKDEGKDVLASDIFKQYIPKLLITGDLEKYFKLSTRYMELLIRLEQWPFVHKEILSQVIVNLSKREIVGAERVLSGSNLNVPGFVQSAEFHAADECIQAVRDNDAELLKKVVAKPCVTYLNTEVVKIAKGMRVVESVTMGNEPPISKQDEVDALLL
jgi:tetratricopeptide (TPR) repeat protein